ncbi:MAG: trypsin-like peptidase domain-containing protein [Gemmatimonadota bacterium]
MSQARRSAVGRKWIGIALLVAFPLGLGLGAVLRAPDGRPTAAGADAAEPRFASLGVEPAGDAAGPLAPTRSGEDEARPGAGHPAGESATARPEPDPTSNGRRYTPIVEATASVAPSVVSVTVLKRVTTTRRDLFDFFVPRQFERTVKGLGSGFAIDTAGHILTNNHVVVDVDSIVVVDARGRRYEARVIGTDELTDIAVLKIPAARVPPAPLGTSSDLMVGEPAIAIGNPFGYLLANSEATVTSGVISGVGRDIQSEEGRGVLLADMVQTDASINPGNSGGPLVNADGRVIGVNSNIFSRSGGSEGLGFAIPIDRALRIADELREFGRIRRPWVGIDAMEIESDTLSRGVTVVRRVAPGSPAARAGLQEGDVLLSLDSRPIDSPLDWDVGLLDAGVRSRVTVRYGRGGKTRTADLTIEELPSEQAERVEVFRGLELITVTPQIAVERRLAVDRGAMIVDIDPRAQRATGLRRGDVIVQLNRREVATKEDAAELFQYYAGRGKIVLFFDRNGSTLYTSFYLR